jgi:hypothetical protein
MKRFLPGLILLCVLSTTAHADDLSEAAKAVETKSYDIALRMYTRLAQNGNDEAQFRLGQMIWNGEGAPADPARARVLFQQAAAAGNVNAVVALKLLDQRASGGSDIAYWTDRYDGADLKAAADCKTPAIPAASKNNEEIAAVFQAMSAWRNCYNGFVQKMNAVLPIGAAIPPNVQAVMSEQQYVKAQTRLNDIYADLTEAQAPKAQATLDRFDRWLVSTEKYAVEHNAEMKGRAMAMRDQIEMIKKQYARQGRDYYPPPDTRNFLK